MKLAEKRSKKTHNLDKRKESLKPRIKMSENQLIAYIRNTPSLNKVFRTFSNDQKRRALEIAEGDTWRLSEILEFVAEEK